MEDVIKLRKQLTRTRVIASILSIFCVLLFVFAYVQKLEADKLMELAIKQEMVAEQARAEAERQHMISMEMQAEAEQQKMQSVALTAQTGESLETVEQLKKELEFQRKTADQHRVLAIKNAEQARQFELKAKQEEVRAQQNAAVAQRAEVAAKKALEDCQNKTNR